MKSTDSEWNEIVTFTKDLYRSREKAFEELAKQDLPIHPELGIPVEVYHLLGLYAEAMRGLQFLWAYKMSEIEEIENEKTTYQK